MELESCRVGFAFCGSFCTYAKALDALEKVKARFGDVTPIVSQASAACDTRFGNAHDFMREMERICDKRVVDTLQKAEPIGPKQTLDALVICPCTGNTLAKLANGITDTPVLMAAKAHLRNGRPLVISVSTNDALGINLKNIGLLFNMKNIYFVPFGQDDPVKKPTSMIAHTGLIEDTLKEALEGRQIQPVIQGV